MYDSRYSTSRSSYTIFSEMFAYYDIPDISPKMSKGHVVDTVEGSRDVKVCACRCFACDRT